MKKVWINPAYKDKIQILEVKKEENPVVKEQAKQKPEKEKEKQQRERKPEKKKENAIVIITEAVMDKLKEKDVNTDKLTDLLNKEFTKESLADELKKRGIPDEDIKRIVCRTKEKKEQKPPPSKQAGKQTIEHKLFQYFMDKEIPIETQLISGETFSGKIKWFSEWLVGLEIDNTRTVIIPRLMMVYYTQLQENSLSDKEINRLPLLDITTVEVNMLQQFKDNNTSLLFHMQGGMKIRGILDWYEKLIYHIKSVDRKTEHTIHRGNILYFEEAV